jgi:hypothetical protein
MGVSPGDTWVTTCATAILATPPPSATASKSSRKSSSAVAGAAAAGDLVDGVWGLQQLGFRLNMELLNRLSSSLKGKVSALKPNQVQQLLTLLTQAKAQIPGYYPPSGLVEETSKVVSAQVTSISSSELTGLVWAVANIGLRLLPSTLKEICRKIYGQATAGSKSMLKPRELVRSFWATTALGYRWLQPQLVEFDRQSRSNMGVLTGGEVVLLLEAFRAHNYSPSQDWLLQLAGEC